MFSKFVKPSKASGNMYFSFINLTLQSVLNNVNRFYLHDHAEHHENVPQSDENPKVSQTEQKLSDVVT